MEALVWFKKYPKVDFAQNAFLDRKEAVAYVKKLQKLGATVEIPWDKDCKEDYTDTMIVRMPAALSKRFDVAVFILNGVNVPPPDEISSNIEFDCHVDWKKDKSIILWWD